MQYLQSIWPLPFLYAISLCMWERCFLYLKLSKSPKNCGKKSSKYMCTYIWILRVFHLQFFGLINVEWFVIRGMLLALVPIPMVGEMLKCCHLSCHFAVHKLDVGWWWFYFKIHTASKLWNDYQKSKFCSGLSFSLMLTIFSFISSSAVECSAVYKFTSRWFLQLKKEYQYTGNPRISWFHNSWSPLFRDSLLVKIS